MHYTEADKSDIKRAFLRRRHNQLALTALFAPFLFAELLYLRGLVSTIFGVSGQVFGPIFFALALGLVLFSHRNWRCPGCSKYLGRSINPKHCPHCGVQRRA